MPAKITNADPAGGVTYCNNNWLNFSGGTFEEFRDFGYHNIMHPDEISEFQERFLKAAETGTELEMEMRFKNQAGEYKWHLNRAAPVIDETGNIQMWIGVTTEIQKAKEEEHRKSEFLKMVSHELKTPITSIKGYVQMLLRMLQKEEEKQSSSLLLKPPLLRIDAQVLRLTRLVSDILDLSRLEESKLELHIQKFRIIDVVQETVQDILHSNSNHTIQIVNDFDCEIYADKDRIGQVIINFITNAIKYSPNNNNIEVRIHKLEKNEVAVSVKDFGIGISIEDQQKIFDRFYRVEGKNENVFAGFGIG
ncbi:PAS domain-containing sensor histidine kinase, partial [Daejeonella sp.]|uniref:sensor histidine kinase n=1 Tax=Daejeonella sp. TaxID=2805397 RepID=UPI0030BB71A6